MPPEGPSRRPDRPPIRLERVRKALDWISAGERELLSTTSGVGAVLDRIQALPDGHVLRMDLQGAFIDAYKCLTDIYRTGMGISDEEWQRALEIFMRKD